MNTIVKNITKLPNGTEMIELEGFSESSSILCDRLNEVYSGIKYMHVKPIEGFEKKFLVSLTRLQDGKCGNRLKPKSVNSRSNLMRFRW